MNKKIVITLLTFLIPIAFVSAQNSTITTLNPWMATTSPYGAGYNAVTQRVYGNPLYLTGLTAGKCVEIAANGLATTSASACGSGSGGGGVSPWATTTSSDPSKLTVYTNNVTDIVTIGSNSTTTAEHWFDPNVPSSYLSGTTTLAGNIIANLGSMNTILIGTTTTFSDANGDVALLSDWTNGHTAWYLTNKNGVSSVLTAASQRPGFCLGSTGVTVPISASEKSLNLSGSMP